MFAQIQIKGRVVDAETGEPLPYANVYADDKNGTLTNADGYFRLLSSEGGGEFDPNVLSHLSTLRYRTILFHIPNDSLEREKEYRLETDMMADAQC